VVPAGQDSAAIGEAAPAGGGRHHAEISATPEHHVVLAVVATPDVVSLPAFMPAVMSPVGVDGLNRLTTRLLTVGRIPKRAGNTARLGRTRSGVRF
jgi:hypothetical protein